MLAAESRSLSSVDESRSPANARNELEETEEVWGKHERTSKRMQYTI